MAGQQGVEMIRLPREEQVFDREAVLGRDASSVFPTEAKAMASSSMDALKEAIGVKKFISESELEAIKSARGASVEDGSIAADKPLAQVLAEARQKKEDEFQDKWKTMKQGKNRPLDEDEAEFLQQLAEEEAARLRQQQEEEEGALDAFRQAIRASQGADSEQVQEAAEAGPQSLASSLEQPEQRQQPSLLQPQSSAARRRVQPLVSVKPLLSVKPAVVKVKPKHAAAASKATKVAERRADMHEGKQEEAAAKRQRTTAPAEVSGRQQSQEQEQQQHTQQSRGTAADQQQEGGAPAVGDALADLLGGYGSDSDSQ